MALPSTYEEWKEESVAWREKTRRYLRGAMFSGPRRRPRGADEAALLRRLGLDKWQPFGSVDGSSQPAVEIRRARKRAGLTQEQLAERLGVSQQYVQQLEDPRRSNPTFSTLHRIASALGSSLIVELRPLRSLTAKHVADDAADVPPAAGARARRR